MVGFLGADWFLHGYLDKDNEAAITFAALVSIPAPQGDSISKTVELGDPNLVDPLHRTP